MSLPVAAILVAAGQSRRFGTDKLWIDIWADPSGAGVWMRCWPCPVWPGWLVVPADGVERFTDALPPDAGERVLVVAAARSGPIRSWPASPR